MFTFNLSLLISWVGGALFERFKSLKFDGSESQSIRPRNNAASYIIQFN